MEFFTSTLLVPMSIIIKRVEKSILVKHFEEAINVEKYMINLKGNLGKYEWKASSFNKKQTSQAKPSSNKKEHDSMDMESIYRISKKISNEIIDLKKGVSEGSSNKHFSKPPFRRTFLVANKPKSPTKGVSIE